MLSLASIVALSPENEVSNAESHTWYHSSRQTQPDKILMSCYGSGSDLNDNYQEKQYTPLLLLSEKHSYQQSLPLSIYVRMLVAEF